VAAELVSYSSSNIIKENNGLCSNSATDEELPMIWRVFSRVPSRPRDPVATCNHGIYVTVEWTEPKHKNRADITGYVIRYYEMFANIDAYTDVLSVDSNSTNFQFTHQLSENTRYQFAVAAVNAVGRGEFSEFSNYVRTDLGKYCCNCHASSLQLSMLQCENVLSECNYILSVGVNEGEPPFFY